MILNNLQIKFILGPSITNVLAKHENEFIGAYKGILFLKINKLRPYEESKERNFIPQKQS